MTKTILSTLIITFATASVFAADCEITTDRTPCKGKETETLKPYGGKNPTVDKKSAADEKACKELAEKSSKIIRKGTLESKKVTAKFDGKDAGSYSDTSTCK